MEENDFNEDSKGDSAESGELLHRQAEDSKPDGAGEVGDSLVAGEGAGEDGEEALLPSLAVAVENEAEEQQSPALMYPVVGFGASAGGLQARLWRCLQHH